MACHVCHEAPQGQKIPRLRYHLSVHVPILLRHRDTDKLNESPYVSCAGDIAVATALGRHRRCNILSLATKRTR